MGLKFACVLALVALGPVCLAQVAFHQQEPLSPPASVVPPDQRCVISGKVLNRATGEIVRRVELRLTQQGTMPGSASGERPSQIGYATTSEPDGTFRIESVEPGDYLLTGSRNGYLETQYGAKGWKRPGTRLLLSAAQKMEGLVLQLNPQAVITGRVVDGDGDPVEGTVVAALKQTWSDGKKALQPFGFGQSNDLGEFRINNLTAGRFYLMAAAYPRFGPLDASAPVNKKSDVREQNTFYPDAAHIETATAIELEAGQNASGMEIRLRKARTVHVRGNLLGALPPGSESNKISVQVTGKDDESLFPFGQNATVSKDRSFDIAGVTPGAYDLTAMEMQKGFQPLSSEPIEVGDNDLNDVTVQIIPPGKLQGQVKVEGKAPAGTAAIDLSTVHVYLSSPEMKVVRSEGVTSDHGALTFENVLPGKYQLQVAPPPRTYLASVRYGQEELLGQELDLRQGAEGEVEVIFRYGLVSLSGNVQSDSTDTNPNASRPAATVLLVPKDRPANFESIKSVSTRQDGSFELKDVPPGAYRAFAFEEMETSNLQNPDLLKQIETMGKEVTLKENDNQQLQLTLIPADGMQQIYARLGMDGE